MGPKFMVQRVEEVDERLDGKWTGEGEAAVLRPNFDQGR